MATSTLTAETTAMNAYISVNALRLSITTGWCDLAPLCRSVALLAKECPHSGLISSVARSGR